MSDREEVIYASLMRTYKSDWLCRAVAKKIDERWDNKGYYNHYGERDEMANYIWMNFCGGDTAYWKAEQIRREVIASWHHDQ